MKAWRFDQGRLNYFQFDEIKKFAAALIQLDGSLKPSRNQPDTVRGVLKHYSTLPFAPNDYYVWRNYGRVFECLLLATEIQGHIFATELCKILASNDELDSDDYLAHFAKNFYYSSPIFQDYKPHTGQIFPVVAIIKFLISEYLNKGKNFISLDEIASYLIVNNVSGLEDIAFYSRLKPKNVPLNVETRQMRELVSFISQFSFLKWEAPNLFLEVRNESEMYAIEKSLQPTLNVQKTNAGQEILQMGSRFQGESLGNFTLNITGNEDEEFTEGKKIRVTHLRSERSSKLKKLYFSKISQPEVCRMCSMDTSVKYPWTSHVIELHHLLPLSSPIKVEKGMTSLKDIEGLCPSCHRATHKYYSLWFKTNRVKDFRNYSEATATYQEIKRIVATT